MYIKKIEGPRVVKLPDGTTLSRADLPTPSTRRWVASRKAKIVKAVRFGLLSREEAMETYNLSHDELNAWASAVERYGEDGLKATAVQKFRLL